MTPCSIHWVTEWAPPAELVGYRTNSCSTVYYWVTLKDQAKLVDYRVGSASTIGL